METQNRVKEFFERRVDKFDSIYAPEKKLIWKILDFLFRRSMQKRFELTLQELKGVKAKKILDIGCGSGRYSIALAQNKIYISGIDFAHKMIEQARIYAKAKGLENFCNFVVGDFLDYQFTEKFDISIAIGFFDYVKKPIKYLQKIKSLTKGKIIMSFPAKWRFRNIIRRVRLKILGCPVYFYSRSDIEKNLKESGCGEFSIKNIGRDYFVIVEV